MNEYYDRHGNIPVVRDISSGTGIPNTSAQRYLAAMKDADELDYNGRRSIGTSRMKVVISKNSAFDEVAIPVCHLK